MTFPDERDRELEELLRTSLRGEADDVNPGGDGLARIRARVDARRSRRAWLRPLAAVGAVALVGGAGGLAYALTRPAPHTDTVGTATTPQDQQPTAPAATTATTPATATSFPTGGMFPFTSAASEHLSTIAWANDPVQVAVHFVSDFAGVSGVDQLVSKSVSGDTASITLGRAFQSGLVHVTTVQLRHFDSSWIVTGATDGGGLLTITSPRTGDKVGTPLLVTGPDYGVDESVQLTVVSLHSAGPLATTHVSFGSDNRSWSQKLRFTPPADPVGAVVAYETSAADGGPQRLAVTAVRFATPTVQAAGYPRYFYGVKNGRIAKLASRNGATVSYVTDPQPGGGASDPQLVGSSVFYLSGSGTCANALTSIPTSGGTSQIVATSNAGYVVTSYAVSADGKNVALFETACQPTSGQPQGLLVSSVRGTATSHTIQFQAFPPMVVGDPAWESDGQHLDAVLRTGNEAGPVRWNAFTDNSSTDGKQSCTTPLQGMPTALALDASGQQWVALQTGSALAVVRCSGDTISTAFSVPGTFTPADLAVTADGQAVLVSDSDGALWRWTTGSAAPAQLSPTVPQQQISW